MRDIREGSGLSRTKPPIRVVIVDDHAMFTQALCFYLQQRAPDICVEAVAHSAHGGVDAAVAARPHVVVMDLLLPDGNGIDAALEIRRRSRTTRVLIVTSLDDVPTMNQALNAGIQGYLVKSGDVVAIIEAVRAVHRGLLVFDERAQRTIIDLAEGSTEPDAHELLILRLAAGGKANREIAREINMSLRTVTRKLGCAYAKLGVTNRAHAIAEAKQRALI